MNYTAAFIGGGNMGSALIRGLIARGLPPGNIQVGEAVQARRIALADELGVHVSADNREIVDGADVVVLAVKPQDMAMTVQSLAPVFSRRPPLVLSIAAGIRVADIAAWCGEGVAVVRAMPNRPALNSAGATAIFAPAGLAPAQRQLAEHVLGGRGHHGVGGRRRGARRGHRAVGQRSGLLLPAGRVDDRRGREARPDRMPVHRNWPSRPCSARAAWRATATATLRACVPRSRPRAAPPKPRCARSKRANLRGIVAAALQAATDRGREMAQAFGENSRK